MKMRCNSLTDNRLTGTSDKLINATFDFGVQYDIYKKLECIENTLDKFDIDVEDLESAMKRLKFLESFFSTVSAVGLYKFYMNGDVNQCLKILMNQSQSRSTTQH